MSTQSEVVCGVPQGSILGPILFLLYINDMCNISNKLKFILFADDTNIFFTDNNVTNCVSKLNAELLKLNKWFLLNKLSLNIAKTNFIVFGKFNNDKNIKVCIDKNELTRVNETKFLGVYIDSNLSWKKHISYFSSKLSKTVGVLQHVRYLLDEKSLYMLYCTSSCTAIFGILL